MDKYAMYLRKSRQDEEAEKLGEGETLARHKKILTELAARKGLYVEKIYKEIISGENIKNRPEIQKLINDCYDGKYRGIIVVDVDRLSRGNQADMQTIMDCLKYSNNRDGLLVVTPTKTYDVSHNSDDEEYIEFVLFMSRREYKTILKRLERGKKQSVVEGNYIGSARPYGYDIVKSKTGRTLIPNPDEAPIVKKIFDWAANDNMTVYQIVKKLNSMGILNYHGEPDWSKHTVSGILKNPLYYGKVTWNGRMTTKRMINGELVTSRPLSNKSEHYMVHDGKHQGIITKELFNTANSRFKVSHTKANNKLKNPFAGLLVCKKCGRTLTYKSYENRPTCNTRLYHPVGYKCNVQSVLYDDVMNAFIQSLKAYIDDFELKVDNLPMVDENTIQSQIEALEKQVKSIKRKLSKLFDSWEDELIDNNEFVARKEMHNKKIETLKNQIAELENTIPEKEEYEEKIVLFHNALDLLKDEDIDAEIKNEYLKKFIEKIEFSRDSEDEFSLDIYLK